jgi:nicotinamidase-related amidase
MRILKDKTVLLIIDIQSKLFPSIYENQKLEQNVIKLINGLDAIGGIPVIVTEQYSKGIGPTIDSVKELLNGKYQPIEKMSFSCCDNPEFMTALKATGKKNLIIIGIESHVCVLQTVIDLIEKDYNPVVIEDCVSSRNINDKNIAIERMRYEGAIISSYESILFELCRYSGTDEFKKMSKIVK